MTQPNTDLMSVLLAHISIERNGGRPLHEQIRGAFEVAIFSGEVPDGAQMPAVRRLANALDIAPNTIVRAYQGLANDGWIQAIPKRGYFVVHAQSELVPAEQKAEIVRVIDEAFYLARRSGLSTNKFLQLVAEHVRDRNEAREIVVIGREAAFLEERVTAIRGAISDLPVNVEGYSFEALETEPKSVASQFANVEWFLVPVGEVERAATLLGPHSNRIIPMTRSLREDVRSFIALQPANTRFGVIAGSSQGASRIAGALKHLHPLHAKPLIASTSEPESIQRVIQKADVLVIGTVARPRIDAYLPLPKPSVDLLYLPDTRTTKELRNRLTNGGAAKSS